MRFFSYLKYQQKKNEANQLWNYVFMCSIFIAKYHKLHIHCYISLNIKKYNILSGYFEDFFPIFWNLQNKESDIKIIYPEFTPKKRVNSL